MKRLCHFAWNTPPPGEGNRPPRRLGDRDENAFQGVAVFEKRRLVGWGRGCRGLRRGKSSMWKRLGGGAAGAVFMAAAGASALELMAGDDAYFKMPDEIAPSQEVEVSFHDVEVDEAPAALLERLQAPASVFGMPSVLLGRHVSGGSVRGPVAAASRERVRSGGAVVGESAFMVFHPRGADAVGAEYEIAFVGNNRVVAVFVKCAIPLGELEAAFPGLFEEEEGEKRLVADGADRLYALLAAHDSRLPEPLKLVQAAKEQMLATLEVPPRHMPADGEFKPIPGGG